MNRDFKNEVFSSYDPHPTPPCSGCGGKPKLIIKMLSPQNGKTVRMFECACGEKTWTESKQ